MTNLEMRIEAQRRLVRSARQKMITAWKNRQRTVSLSIDKVCVAMDKAGDESVKLAKMIKKFERATKQKYRNPKC